MPSVINSLIPIFTLIFSGVLMKRSNFLPEDFWPAAEKLTYYLLTPALLIYSLANKKVDDLPWREMLLTVQGTVLISALLLSLWWLLTGKRKARSSLRCFRGAFASIALSRWPSPKRCSAPRACCLRRWALAL
jgi:predicted permease